MSYKSIHTGQQIDTGVSAALNPDTIPTAGSDALMTSGGTKSAIDNAKSQLIVSGNTTVNPDGAAYTYFDIPDLILSDLSPYRFAVFSVLDEAGNHVYYGGAYIVEVSQLNLTSNSYRFYHMGGKFLRYIAIERYGNNIRVTLENNSAVSGTVNVTYSVVGIF